MNKSDHYKKCCINQYGAIDTDMRINSKYKYTDDDVNKILKIIVTESTKKWPRPTFYIAPISEQSNKLVTLLREEKENNKKHVIRILLIPYLIGYHKDGHWVGIVVRFKNNNAEEIEYYDSLPGGKMTQKLKKDLKNVYGINAIFIKEPNNIIKQNDISSCGPCMIQNLINAATVKLTSDEIRKHHILLMENIEKGLSNIIEKVDHMVIENNPSTAATKENSTHDSLQIQNTEDILIDGYVKIDQYFPRCEFKARYKGTTIFYMHDPEYWGSYFRSTSRGGNADRIAKIYRDKTYKNTNINQSVDKKDVSPYITGAIYSPFKYKEYKRIFLDLPIFRIPTEPSIEAIFSNKTASTEKKTLLI